MMTDTIDATRQDGPLAQALAALVQAHVEGLENGGTDEHLAKVGRLKADVYGAASALVTLPLAPVKNCREDFQSLALELYAMTLIETGRLIMEAGEHALKSAGDMQRAAGFDADAPNAGSEAPQQWN